jgi:NAD(P)-dependent dehydrogenase (short-subunit alcohol dehydrogenase family)
MSSRVAKPLAVTVLTRLAPGVIFFLFGADEFVNHARNVRSFALYGLPSPSAFSYGIGTLEIIGALALFAGVGRLAGWAGLDYSSAKAAVIHLSRCAAVELGEHGIRVNSISPGPILTGIFGKGAGMDPAEADRTASALEPAFLDALEKHQPIRRVGVTDYVARAALWLASDASSFVTGQDVAVDGGISAGRPASVAIAERATLAKAFAAIAA